MVENRPEIFGVGERKERAALRSNVELQIVELQNVEK
jgi:hypothetical protein